VDSGVTWIHNSAAVGIAWFSLASSADGNLLVAGTFGAGIALSHLTPQPVLAIGAPPGDLALCWTVHFANFVLKYSPTRGTGWTDVSAPPVMNLTNLNYEVVVSSTNSAGFYRLSP
jgi:hypothetical protein